VWHLSESRSSSRGHLPSSTVRIRQFAALVGSQTVYYCQCCIGLLTCFCPRLLALYRYSLHGQATGCLSSWNEAKP
jgi:hypothetical protein